jgi:DNA-binding SARP family transcriptional activator
VGATVGLFDGVREPNERRAALRAGTRRVRALIEVLLVIRSRAVRREWLCGANWRRAEIELKGCQPFHQDHST